MYPIPPQTKTAHEKDFPFPWAVFMPIMALAVPTLGSMGSIIRGLIASNSGVIVDEDTLQFAMEDPRTVEALEFLSDIFANGWWYYDRHEGNPMGDWNRNSWLHQEGNSDDIFMLYEALHSWARNEPDLLGTGPYSHMRRVWLTEDCVQRVIHVVSARSNEKFDIGFAVPELTWVFGTFAHELFHGTSTPMQIIETQRPSRQEMIDIAFNR